MSDDDLSLVKRLQDGDENALEQLMERYKNPLYGFIYRYVQTGSEAADILEETFVKLYINRSKFEPRAKFSTWLYTIAGNLCRDHARKKKRRPGDYASGTDHSVTLEKTSDPAFSDMGPSPAEAAARNEDYRLLQATIQTLPHELKTALVLFSLEGNSQEETAAKLGCSAKAVESRVYRAKKILKKKLGDLLESR